MLLYQVNYDYLPYIRALVLPMTGELYGDTKEPDINAEFCFLKDSVRHSTSFIFQT